MKNLESILSKNKASNIELDSFRLKRVNDYLNWFEPPWNALSEEQRMILTEFYMNDNLKSGAGVRLQFKCNYSERQLYRIKGDALLELSKYLFGK